MSTSSSIVSLPLSASTLTVGQWNHVLVAEMAKTHHQFCQLDEALLRCMQAKNDCMRAHAEEGQALHALNGAMRALLLQVRNQ